MRNDDASDADVDRGPDERADDEDLPEWGRPEMGQGRRPEDVAGVATDRSPRWLDNRARWLLIVAGLVLIFIPEPVTTMLGLGFVVGGILLWLADLFQ